MAQLNFATKTVRTPVFTAEGAPAARVNKADQLRRLLNACMLWEDNFYSDGQSVADRMREMEHLASGLQLADENLGVRPARFMTDEHLARLDRLRAVHDPEGRFHTWMGRPAAPAEIDRAAR